MTATYFADTNLLVYACSTAPVDAVKRDRARAVLSSGVPGISTQVLQEFFVVAVHPKKLNLPRALAQNHLDFYSRLPLHVVDLATIREAVSLAERHQLSYWDAQILVSAAKLGCTRLLSEDLNHGQNYDGVSVENPFRRI